MCYDLSTLILIYSFNFVEPVTFCAHFLLALGIFAYGSEEDLLVIIVSFSQSGSLCPIVDCFILLRRTHRTVGRLNAAQH